MQAAGQQVRAALAAYRDKEDLISIGAYQRGSDPLVDVAIDLRPKINDFLRQRVDDPTPAEDADRRLLEIGGELGVDSAVPPPAPAESAGATCRHGLTSRRPERDPVAQPVGDERLSPALKYIDALPITKNMNGPSYRFRLERVRALRERREEQAKQEFASALHLRQRSPG